jgi:hypothetical protein
MLFQLAIVSVVQNVDGTLRVTIKTADNSFSTEVTLPASQAQNCYIGRTVYMKIDFNPIP